MSDTAAQSQGDPFSAVGGHALTILTRLRVEHDKLAKFNALFAAYAECVRTHEAGCLSYQVVRAIGAPTAVLVIARYRSLEAYRDHLQATHTVSILSMLDPLLEDHPVMEVYLDGERTTQA